MYIEIFSKRKIFTCRTTYDNYKKINITVNLIYPGTDTVNPETCSGPLILTNFAICEI